MRDRKTDEAVDLGKWIGRRQAFALVAGRCSATLKGERGRPDVSLLGKGTS